MRQQQDVERERSSQGQRAGEPQHLVRGEGEEQPRPRRPQQEAEQAELTEVPDGDAHAAGEAAHLGRLLAGHGVGRVDRAVAAGDDVHGDLVVVVDPDLRQVRAQLAADGVERAVGAEDARQGALAPLDERLVAPVEALLAAERGLLGPQDAVDAADAAHPGVGEGPHQPPQAVRPEAARGVAERHDLAPRPLDAVAQHGQLPAVLLEGQYLDPAVRILLGHGHGPVGRAVAQHQDLELALRVVERHAAFELGAQGVLLVVRGDEQRHRRRHVGAPGLPANDARKDPEQQRVAQVGKPDEADQDPERDGHCSIPLACHCRPPGGGGGLPRSRGRRGRAGRRCARPA